MPTIHVKILDPADAGDCIKEIRVRSTLVAKISYHGYFTVTDRNGIVLGPFPSLNAAEAFVRLEIFRGHPRLYAERVEIKR
jgi:hypothetical protein